MFLKFSEAFSEVSKALQSDPLRAKEMLDSLKRIIDKSVGPLVEVVQEKEVPRSLKLTLEVRNRIIFFY